MLPSILAAEQAAEQQQKEEAFQNKQFDQQKKQFKKERDFQQEESRKGLGLSIAKFGGTALQSDFGFNVGHRTPIQGRGMGSPGAGGRNPADTGSIANAAPKGGGFFSGLNAMGGLQGAVGGAGLGFGLGTLLGGGSKKKQLLGAGLGAFGGAAFGSGAISSALSGIGNFLGIGN
jgi:hypothetical protein